MSIDAGGLAQMTYQSPFNNNSIGTSGPGFASRGKGTHIKRLSVAPPPKISTIDETQQINNLNSAATPRTSRGHLLAGLRTAPKSATVAPGQHRFSLESSKYADPQYKGGSHAPQTASGAYFPNGKTQNGNYQSYAHPDQVLAPPTLDFQSHGVEGIDQDLYDELLATNNYLAQQQRALQQQLLSINAAAQQFGSLNLNTMNTMQQQFQSPVDTPMSLYHQQSLSGMQPIVSPVPGSPGVFSVYNPMTGQSSYVVDNSAPEEEQPTQPNNYSTLSPQTAPNFQRQTSDSSNPSHSRIRSTSPPKSTPSPQQEVEPLPPPSANAFRRGHRKGLSSANIKTNGEWTRNAGTGPRSAGYPQTPMTGTFQPGHGRAGEHPTRQPKNPPNLQELEEKPTSKHEGSKNFATRQRRRAVHDLVRAGKERRNDSRQPASGAGTPGSENEFNFSVSSDNDSVLAGSTSMTSKPSLGSLRARANGAIGSERKEKSRERSSVDSTGALSAKSLSSDEGNAVGGPYVEVDAARRKTPLLVLSSAEKRKSVAL